MPRPDPNAIYDQTDAYQKARAIARYSCYTYIAWKRRDGQHRYARLTEHTIKQAMLDVGTQGRVTQYDRMYGSSYRWAILNNIRRQLKAGYYR